MKTTYNIIGGRKKVREQLVDPLEWAVNRLFPNHHVHINIELQKIELPYLGFCFIDGDTEIYRPREFTIELNKNLEVNNLIITLFHELTHVKQFVKGEMKQVYNDVSFCYWFGEKISYDSAKDNDFPWEIEAYESQKILFEKYIGE